MKNLCCKRCIVCLNNTISYYKYLKCDCLMRNFENKFCENFCFNEEVLKGAGESRLKIFQRERKNFERNNGKNSGKQFS